MRVFSGIVAASLGSAVLACSSFQTLESQPDAGADQAADRMAPPGKDATAAEAGRDATLGDAARDAREASTTDGHAEDALDSGSEAAPPVDTVCLFPWVRPGACVGRSSFSVGSVRMSDDPRIDIARSASGRIAICYADFFSDDFLMRSVHALIFFPTMVEQASPITLFSGETDTTGACALAGGTGDTFHTVVYDTENDVLEYGDITPTSVLPAFQTFGPSSVAAYLRLGLLAQDPSHVMAVVGNATAGTIQSYAGATFDGGATFEAPLTAASGIGYDLLGSGEFSLRSAAGTPTLLIDVEPVDAAAASFVELTSLHGSIWTPVTLEGATLTAVLGYSPSLAVADGGVRAVYYQQGLGAPDAATSQLHVTPVQDGSVGTPSTPLDASPDNDPNFPLIGAAAAVGPDGRLHIAFVASSAPGKVTLYEARPQSTAPGAPILIDTVDQSLSEADSTSVNMLIEPSGRIDITYMRLDSGQVYFATRDP